MSDIERRNAEREPMLHILWFNDAGACYYSGKILDASNKGLKITARFLPEQLEKHEAELTLKPGDKVTIGNSTIKWKCTIRWCDYDGENCVFGVEFEKEVELNEWQANYTSDNPHYLSIYSQSF